MLSRLVTAWLRRLGGRPCFRIYGKQSREPKWRVIDVYATHRRDFGSRWPLWRATCLTWTDEVIAVGWDFAGCVFREQCETPASREHPVQVVGGRIGDVARRQAAGGSSFASASEILAHECGHTGQVLRFGALYWPMVGSVTLCREGRHWWNHFENDASERGQFGGIVKGSVCPDLLSRAG